MNDVNYRLDFFIISGPVNSFGMELNQMGKRKHSSIVKLGQAATQENWASLAHTPLANYLIKPLILVTQK